MTYKTTDLYFTAVLMALGYLLKDIRPIDDTKRKEFILEYDVKLKVPDIIMNDYYGNNIKVQAKSLIDSIKEIKSRLYQT